MKPSTGLLFIALAIGAGSFAPKASAASTEIDACGTLAEPGSYVVVTNLDAAGDCLVITAEFVNIDLGGFVLAGNGEGAGISIGDLPGPIRSARGIVVKNGTVFGFRDGIDLSNAFGAVVEGVEALNNEGTGIQGSLFNASVIRDSVAQSNGGVGIAATDGSVVTNNAVVGNGIGIGVVGAGVIAGNAAHFNSDIGISVGQGSIVSGNAAMHNDIGIAVTESGSSTVSGNTTHLNRDIGMRINCPSNVFDNTATENLNDNLVLVGRGCRASRNLAP